MYVALSIAMLPFLREKSFAEGFENIWLDNALFECLSNPAVCHALNEG